MIIFIRFSIYLVNDFQKMKESVQKIIKKMIRIIYVLNLVVRNIHIF